MAKKKPSEVADPSLDAEVLALPPIGKPRTLASGEKEQWDGKQWVSVYKPPVYVPPVMRAYGKARTRKKK